MPKPKDSPRPVQASTVRIAIPIRNLHDQPDNRKDCDFVVSQVQGLRWKEGASIRRRTSSSSDHQQCLVAQWSAQRPDRILPILACVQQQAIERPAPETKPADMRVSAPTRGSPPGRSGLPHHPRRYTQQIPSKSDTEGGWCVGLCPWEHTRKFTQCADENHRAIAGVKTTQKW